MKKPITKLNQEKQFRRRLLQSHLKKFNRPRQDTNRTADLSESTRDGYEKHISKIDFAQKLRSNATGRDARNVSPESDGQSNAKCQFHKKHTSRAS